MSPPGIWGPYSVVHILLKVIQHLLPICIHILRYREKYFKRRTVYSASHPGSYNPSVITNQEAHMIYGNMEGTGTETLQDQMRRAKQRKKPKQFPIIFLLRCVVHSKKRTTCSGLMKTALNNVVLPTLFKVVNNTEQVDESELACNQV